MDQYESNGLSYPGSVSDIHSLGTTFSSLVFSKRQVCPTILIFVGSKTEPPLLFNFLHSKQLPEIFIPSSMTLTTPIFNKKNASCWKGSKRSLHKSYGATGDIFLSLGTMKNAERKCQDAATEDDTLDGFFLVFPDGASSGRRKRCLQPRPTNGTRPVITHLRKPAASIATPVSPHSDNDSDDEEIVDASLLSPLPSSCRMSASGYCFESPMSDGEDLLSPPRLFTPECKAASRELPVPKTLDSKLFLPEW